MTKTIALLGAGWLGEPLARRLQISGYRIKAATTTPEKAERLRAAGLDAYLVDLAEENAKLPAAFFRADILVLTVPPGGRRDPEVEHTYPQRVSRALAAAQKGGVQHVLFTSSTGIYGEQAGVVTEDSPLRPQTASGKALVEVEDRLREAYREHLTILRLAGLVGGQRQPGRWFAGKQDVSGGEQVINLVHREDVLVIMEQVIKGDHWGHTLNVCADEHPTKAVFYPAAAKALGMDVPSFAVSEEKSSGKLVDNRKGKELLNYSYVYPDPMKFPTSYKS